MRYFSRLHPFCALLYFMAAVILTALNATPVTAGLSLVFSLSFAFFISGKKSGLKSVALFIPFAAVFSFINAVFVRSGISELFTVFSVKITLEALLYGVNSAATVYAILIWCGVANKVITSEKTAYLFGKVAPKTSLVLTMTFGFVPKTVLKFNEISDAQKGIGAYSAGGFKRFKAKLNAVLSLVAAQLENSVAVADSMRARGYGLKNRTNATVKKITANGVFLCVLFLFLGVAGVTLALSPAGDFSFYPQISAVVFSGSAVAYYCVSAALFALPSVLEIKDDLKWNYLKSKI